MPTVRRTVKAALIHSNAPSLLISLYYPQGKIDLQKTPTQAYNICFSYESIIPVGVAASQDQDFGTANLHVEVSDVVSVLVYVGLAKGNGVLSKTGKTGTG